MKKKDLFPDVIRLESSALCNFNCLHCSNGQEHPNHRRVLSKEIYNQLFYQFKEKHYIPRVLVLYHGGEPLINRDLEEYIFDSRTFGVKNVKIVTNASLLTEERSKSLLEAGLTSIDISFDGYSPNENNYIRRNASFERDIKNAIRFIQLAEKYDISIRIGNVQILTREEATDKKLVRSTPDYLRYYLGDYLDKITIESYPAYFWPDYVKNDIFDVYQIECTKETYCANLFETISVMTTGEVVSCCYDIKGSVVFGNIKECNIFDIWNNQKYVAFRNGIRNGKPDEFCKKCTRYSGLYLIQNDNYPF